MSCLTLCLREPGGAVRLDLAEQAGFAPLPEVGAMGVEWAEVIASSLWVDGDFTSSARLAATQRSFLVRIRGASDVEVEGRVEALIAAVSSPSLLDIGTGTVVRRFRASRANVSVSFTPVQARRHERVATLTFRLQPHPIVTGV